MAWRLTTAILLMMGLAADARAVKSGELFPAIQIAKHGEGKALSQETLKGKVTVVNFWATWCEACKVELKEFDAQLRDLAKKENVQVAFVSLDKEISKSVAWIKEKMPAGSIMDGALYTDAEFAAAETLEVDSFPMTLVIDQQGKIVHIQRGFEAGKGHTEKMVQVVEKLAK